MPLKSILVCFLAIEITAVHIEIATMKTVMWLFLTGLGYNYADQKKQVREISKGSGRKRTWVRNSSEDLTHVSKKSSVAEAAAAFLVEASKELHAAHDKPSDKSDKEV